MANDIKSPMVGDTVIFHGYSTHNGTRDYPALVVQKFTGPYVNLTAFPPFQPPEYQGSILHRDEAMEQGFDIWWCWPDELPA